MGEDENSNKLNLYVEIILFTKAEKKKKRERRRKEKEKKNMMITVSLSIYTYAQHNYLPPADQCLANNTVLSDQLPASPWGVASPWSTIHSIIAFHMISHIWNNLLTNSGQQSLIQHTFCCSTMLVAALFHSWSAMSVLPSLNNKKTSECCQHCLSWNEDTLLSYFFSLVLKILSESIRNTAGKVICYEVPQIHIQECVYSKY